MTIGRDLHPETEAEVDLDGSGRVHQPPSVWRTLTRRPTVKHTGPVSLTGSDVVNTLVLIVLGIVMLWTLVPGWVTAYDPLVGDAADKFLPPDLSHWFGTDRPVVTRSRASSTAPTTRYKGRSSAR